MKTDLNTKLLVDEEVMVRLGATHVLQVLLPVRRLHVPWKLRYFRVERQAAALWQRHVYTEHEKKVNTVIMNKRLKARGKY